MENNMLLLIRGRRTQRISHQVAVLITIFVTGVGWPAFAMVARNMLEQGHPFYAVAMNLMGSVLIIAMAGLWIGFFYAWATGRRLRKLSDFHPSDVIPR